MRDGVAKGTKPDARRMLSMPATRQASRQSGFEPLMWDSCRHKSAAILGTASAPQQ